MMSEERIGKRRLRSGQACIGCRKRKHRCDGGRPKCGGCQSRSVTCQYPSDTTTIESVGAPCDLGQQQSPSPVNRLQRYQLQPEQQSSVAISARMDGWSPASTDLISGDAVPPTISQPYQPNETSCVSSRLQNGVSNASSPSEPGGPDGYFGDSSTFAFVSKVQPESQNNNGVHLPTKRNRELSTSHSMQITDGSTSRSTSDNGDIYKLPERHLADNLVDGYFDRVHPLYPFVHEGSFRAEYERMWAHMSDNPLRPLWYALLNLIFALGCEFCDAIPEETVMTTISPLVARSRHIIFSYGFSRSTLELVQVLLLMCHYLQGTLELNECWNLVGLMIRSAVSIGLHLNPDNLPLPTVEKEVRKRVWWGCFTIDRTLSMKFGRPLSIQTADVCDVPLPLEVDDQYIHNSSTPRQPAGRPSITAFFIYTIKLAKVIDNILRDLYTTNKRTSRQTSTDNALPVSSSQSRILGHAVLLDGQLQSWWKEIPAHLHPESRIVDGRVFQRQKFVIHVRHLQIRILLQRQLLLIFGRQHIDDDFLRAVAIAGSQTCISAARQTVRMIHSQYHRGLLNSLWYNLHYIFTSLGVLFYLETMDKSRLKLLAQDQEYETIEWGMEFLKTASNTSDLAARYLAMLRRVRDQTRQADVQSSETLADGLGCASSQTNNIDDASQPPLISSTAKAPWQTNSLQNPRGEFDIDGMNFDELLFGTGLPQDVFSFDYPNAAFLP